MPTYLCVCVKFHTYICSMKIEKDLLLSEEMCLFVLVVCTVQIMKSTTFCMFNSFFFLLRNILLQYYVIPKPFETSICKVCLLVSQFTSMFLLKMHHLHLFSFYLLVSFLLEYGTVAKLLCPKHMVLCATGHMKLQWCLKN